MTDEYLEKLQIIFEDIRNQLTIFQGFIQINTKNELNITHIEFIFNSICDSNKLINNGLAILEEIKTEKNKII